MNLSEDAVVLRGYLAARDLVRADAEVRRIGDGHSNVIYLVGDATSGVVVRRPPPLPHPPGAHDVVREARIQQALTDFGVPVPLILAVEESPEFLGVPFYVMEHLAGHVLTTATPAVFGSPPQRRAIAEAFIDALVALHAVDPVAAGLAAPTPRALDVTRPLARLARLLSPHDAPLGGRLGSLHDALLEAAPTSQHAVVAHGDYRPGNLMLAAGPPARVLAILDWELAGIADPLTDLGYFLATYARAQEPAHAITEVGRATCEEGYPERAELAARYAAATGRDTSAIAWYMTAALWKLAVLFEYQRRRLLTGSGDPFYGRDGLVDGLLDAAETIFEGERV